MGSGRGHRTARAQIARKRPPVRLDKSAQNFHTRHKTRVSSGSYMAPCFAFFNSLAIRLASISIDADVYFFLEVKVIY